MTTRTQKRTRGQRTNIQPNKLKWNNDCEEEQDDPDDTQKDIKEEREDSGPETALNDVFNHLFA